MKKFILIVLLVGIVGFAGLSIWGSLRAKQAYRNLILAIAESPDARVLETSYEPGWVQSRAHASVEVRGALGESFQQLMVGLGRDEVRGRVGVRMEQSIEHGYTPLLEWLTTGVEGTPILGRVETHLELDEETESEIAAVAGRMPPISISTVIRASGIAETAVTVPARHLEREMAGEDRLAREEGEAWAARWEGLRGTVVHTTDFDHFAASFESAGIEGGGAGSGFAFRDLKWTADLARDESGLLVGDVHTSVGSLRLSSGEENASGLEVDRWTVAQSSAVEAGSFGTALRVHVGAIRLGEQSFGPGEIEFQLQHLDAHSLARLQSQSVGGFSSPESQDVARATVDGGATSLLSALASRSPQLEIRSLRLATPSGDLKAKLRIDVDGSDPRLLRNLYTLLLVLQVHAEFECPAAILEAFYQDREEELLELRRQGWVLLDGERYRSRLAFEGGELVVNGIPKALDTLPAPPATPETFPQVSAADSGPEGVAAGPELLP
jgi:uncharacterized protein YdgA (DUF945 family)